MFTRTQPRTKREAPARLPSIEASYGLQLDGPTPEREYANTRQQRDQHAHRPHRKRWHGKRRDDAVRDRLGTSVRVRTRIVKVDVPALVIVPESTPAAVSVRPAGSAPLVTPNV